jgi:hypothetical protein
MQVLCLNENLINGVDGQKKVHLSLMAIQANDVRLPKGVRIVL